MADPNFANETFCWSCFWFFLINYSLLKINRPDVLRTVLNNFDGGSYKKVKLKLKHFFVYIFWYSRKLSLVLIYRKNPRSSLMRRIWNFRIYDNLWSGIFLDHLGFLQSTWTDNIIWRSILYLLFACKRWLPIKSVTVSNDWWSFPIWSGTVFDELIPWMITLIEGLLNSSYPRNLRPVIRE